MVWFLNLRAVVDNSTTNVIFTLFLLVIKDFENMCLWR